MKETDVTGFFEQLYPLINNGIVLSEALTIIENQKGSEKLTSILIKINLHIQNGNTLSDCMRQHPKYFSSMDCSLIQAGEETGKLAKLVKKLIEFRKQHEKTKQQIKKALFYPAIVFCTAIIITTGLLIFIIPQFQEVFASFNTPLPWLTQKVIVLSDTLQQYGLIILLTVIGIIMGLRLTIKKSRTCLYYFQYCLLKLPLFGKLLTQSSASLYCTILAISHQSGIPLIQGIDLAKQATPFIAFQNRLTQCQMALTQGVLFSTAWQQQKLMDSDGIALLVIGENSGQLSTMLDTLAKRYSEKTQHFIDYLSKLIEPLIMVILAIVTGGLIIAMYLPIFNISAAIK